MQAQIAFEGGAFKLPMPCREAARDGEGKTQRGSDQVKVSHSGKDRLIQVIVSPDFTVMVGGLNMKSLISIVFFLPPTAPLAASSPQAARQKFRRTRLVNRIAFLFC